MRRSKVFWWASAAVLGVAIVAVVGAGPLMSRVEQPAYTVVTAEGPIEVRDYGPMIAAEVVVSGERKAAIADGFRLIAAYIFGANRRQAKVAMTAPVEQQKLAVTATDAQPDSDGSWTVRFIMPRGWTLDTLPAPDDPRITLKPISARRVLAIRFSGSDSTSLFDEKTAVLRAYASREHLRTEGEPLFAFYNPPWTLPWLRRNEVMLDLAGPT